MYFKRSCSWKIRDFETLVVQKKHNELFMTLERMVDVMNGVGDNG